MKAALLSLVAIVVCSAALAAPARADDSRTTKREADRHFKSGVALADEGKYAEALAEFERAYEIAPHPLVLYNIAGCHRELSQYAEAVKFYRRFLEEGKGQVPAVPHQAGRAGRAHRQGQRARPTGRGRSGWSGRRCR